MTPQEINDSIHKALGWAKVNRPGAISGWDNYQWQKGDDISTWATPSPNYHGSLDAMHEAEKILTGAQCLKYVEYLNKVQGYFNHITPVILVMATAPQRAEAFLRTIGKWSEQARKGEK